MLYHTFFKQMKTLVVFFTSISLHLNKIHSNYLLVWGTLRDDHLVTPITDSASTHNLSLCMLDDTVFPFICLELCIGILHKISTRGETYNGGFYFC